MNRGDPFAIFGFRGEAVMREHLKNEGFWVFTTEFSGGDRAPLMESVLRQYVLPDLQACKGGLSRWIEVKSKQSASKHRNSGTLQTGCFIRHFTDYLAIEQATGIPGWIGFQHAMDARIYMQSIDILKDYIHHPKGPLGAG